MHSFSVLTESNSIPFLSVNGVDLSLLCPKLVLPSTTSERIRYTFLDKSFSSIQLLASKWNRTPSPRCVPVEIKFNPKLVYLNKI